MTYDYIFAGWYDESITYNPNTDEFDLRKLKITCPVCKREFAALLSKHTKAIRHFKFGSDYDLVGVEFETYCRMCRNKFTFKLDCS